MGVTFIWKASAFGIERDPPTDYDTSRRKTYWLQP